MQKFCHSCGAPLDMPDFKGPADDYCINCTDEQGKLKSADEIKFGLAEWFKMWQPELKQDQALQRAGHYMKAMPAWAEA